MQKKMKGPSPNFLGVHVLFFMFGWDGRSKMARHGFLRVRSSPFRCRKGRGDPNISGGLTKRQTRHQEGRWTLIRRVQAKEETTQLNVIESKTRKTFCGSSCPCHDAPREAIDGDIVAFGICLDGMQEWQTKGISNSLRRRSKSR